AVFARTGAAVRVYGGVLSGMLASATAGFAIAFARESFKPRVTAWGPGATRTPGLSPEFDRVFALAPSGEYAGWAPSERAQRWLVARRDKILRIRSEGQRLAVALLPLPGSRPGYPRPLDGEALDQIVAFAADLPGVIQGQLVSDNVPR